MATINLDVETIASNILHGEFEQKINSLKLDFLKLQQSIKEKNQDSDECKEHFHLQLEAMREWVSRNHLDISRCSSLFAVPTQQLGEDEKLIHRVWMGGGLPEPTKSAMLQWDAAINAVNDNAFKSILWVWDEDQLGTDPHYVSTGGAGEFTLGQYRFGDHVSHVNSLKLLALAKAEDYFSAVNLLHDKGYYATLSDYFRFMIVIEFGGMYMDSDTIPYKPAALFLAKPEVPDYSHYVQNDAGEWQCHHLDWMNLFLDETGLIVARKNNQSLRSILDKLHEQYMCLPQGMPYKNREFELFVFEQLYDEWKLHIGCSFMSHDQLTQTYSVLFHHQTEPVLCGMRGMRLSHDIITGIHLPLDEQEGQSYDRCIANLTQADWTLDNALDLAQMGDVYYVDEVPRMAYPLQLRSDIEHYHYYNVLSTDEYLDRVNQVFGDFMIASNQQAIERGSFWHGVTSRAEANIQPHNHNRLTAREAVRFTPGDQTSETDRHEMAKLIFETSYLEYCSAGNVLGLNLTELQKKQNIEPYLSLLDGIYDYSSGEFMGFVISGSCAQYDAIKAPYYYRDDMKAVDNAYDDFVLTHLRDDDYFISTVALKSSARGQGVFSQVFNRVKKDAQAKQCSRVVLTVYESSDALAIYQKMGFEVIGTFDYVQDIFFDNVQLLAYNLTDR